jgi:hypothetical protein
LFIWLGLFFAGQVPFCSAQSFGALNYFELLAADQLDEQVLQLLETARDDPKTEQQCREVRQEFLSAPTSDEQCSASLVRVHLSAWSQSRPAGSEMHRFYEFIRASNKREFKRCAKLVSQALVERGRETKVAAEFQQLYGATFRLKSPDSHSHLLEVLQRFDLSRDRFDARRTVRVVEQLARVETAPREAD